MAFLGVFDFTGDEASTELSDGLDEEEDRLDAGLDAADEEGLDFGSFEDETAAGSSDDKASCFVVFFFGVDSDDGG